MSQYRTTTSPVLSTAVSVNPTSESKVPVSSQLPTSSLPPVSTANTPPSPTTPPVPSSEKCRINVKEYDDVTASVHGVEISNAGIYPDTGRDLIDSAIICGARVEADEHTGFDFDCPPLGEKFHLERDQDETLRFIRGKETWTAKDERCKILSDWHESDDLQKVCSHWVEWRGTKC